MKAGVVRRYTRSQSGYTLVELLVASAIGVMLMTGLTSVVLTTSRAAAAASSRVEASSEIREFQSFAYADFAPSSAPTALGCGTPGNPCTTQPLVLNGVRASNATPPVTAPVVVTYSWDGSANLDRQVGASAVRHVATDVTAFWWYVDSSAEFATVVVSMTVTVGTYSESQVFRFYLRPNP